MGGSRSRIQSPEELLPYALKIRTELGEMPTANQLAHKLSVGHPKAKRILELVKAHDSGVELAPTTIAVREFTPPWGSEPVRIVERDGEPWFVAQDLERELGILNIRTALSLLDGPDKDVCSTYTPGGAQQMVIVSESGMWELMMMSRKAEAVKLRKWLTHDVLPALRKTGTYTMPGVQGDRYADDPLYQMITRVIDNGYQIIALEKRQTTTEGEVESLRAEFKRTGELVKTIKSELGPKVQSWQSLVNSEGLIELAVAAQSIKFTPPGRKAKGRTTFDDYLREIGWLAHNEPGFKGTRPTQYSVDRGWMDVKKTWIENIRSYRSQALLTPKGYEALIQKVGTIPPQLNAA